MAKNEQTEGTLLSRTFKNKEMDKKKKLVFDIFDPPPKTPFFDQKTPFLATRGPKLKKPRAHSYVHFIYEDIV